LVGFACQKPTSPGRFMTRWMHSEGLFRL